MTLEKPKKVYRFDQGVENGPDKAHCARGWLHFFGNGGRKSSCFLKLLLYLLLLWVLDFFL
jgi:hypothetical protein